MPSSRWIQRANGGNKFRWLGDSVFLRKGCPVTSIASSCSLLTDSFYSRMSVFVSGLASKIQTLTNICTFGMLMIMLTKVWLRGKRKGGGFCPIRPCNMAKHLSLRPWAIAVLSDPGTGIPLPRLGLRYCGKHNPNEKTRGPRAAISSRGKAIRGGIPTSPPPSTYSCSSSLKNPWTVGGHVQCF